VWTENDLTLSYSLQLGGQLFFTVVSEKHPPNTSVIAAECLIMFGVCDVTEAVATRSQICSEIRAKQQCICEICAICSYVSYLSYFIIYVVLPISVNRDVSIFIAPSTHMIQTGNWEAVHSLHNVCDALLTCR